MAEWRPEIEAGDGYIHERIAAALRADVARGVLAPGARLPTHRRLAELLGVGVGAVTRAYAAAEYQGLVTAHVGRGSFIAQPATGGADVAAREGPIDLARNLPPAAPARARLAEALGRLRQRGDLLTYLDYPPTGGAEAHRRAAGAWLAKTANWPGLDWRRPIVTGGAQQAFAVAIGAACRPGASLIVEAASFTGVKALAAHMDYRLVPAGMDAEGLTPDALDEVAARSGARLAYVLPVQNPTARIMGLERRRAIVEVARKRDLLIVEDDLYGAYASELGLPPLAALAPERVFYVSGLSKSLAPGLRVGYCVPPTGDDWRDRCLSALRAIAFGAPGLGALVATQWIEDGTAADILSRHRLELADRARLALEILGPAAERPANRAATHLWLPMSELDAERAAARALRDGVEVTAPSAPFIAGGQEYGLRVCLGAAPSLAVLEQGLRTLSRALGERPDRALGMV
ncbi:MAG TPA: PLP-dependent aminotransferase family protein [Caulobacteraceae bacterium]|jgi:DNA-binding transcriptional MocR family regulator